MFKISNEIDNCKIYFNRIIKKLKLTKKYALDTCFPSLNDIIQYELDIDTNPYSVKEVRNFEEINNIKLPLCLFRYLTEISSTIITNNNISKITFSNILKPLLIKKDIKNKDKHLYNLFSTEYSLYFFDLDGNIYGITEYQGRKIGESYVPFVHEYYKIDSIISFINKYLLRNIFSREYTDISLKQFEDKLKYRIEKNNGYKNGIYNYYDYNNDEDIQLGF